MNSRIIMCDTSSRSGRRCQTIESLTNCDPRCGQYLQPEGYVQAAQWADEMLKTHDQLQCYGCGRWTVWERRRSS